MEKFRLLRPYKLHAVVNDLGQQPKSTCRGQQTLLVYIVRLPFQQRSLPSVSIRLPPHMPEMASKRQIPTPKAWVQLNRRAGLLSTFHMCANTAK